MGELVHRSKVPKKGMIQENRRWFCEVCGSQLDIDPESGEQHCLTCETPEE